MLGEVFLQPVIRPKEGENEEWNVYLAKNRFIVTVEFSKEDIVKGYSGLRIENLEKQGTMKLVVKRGKIIALSGGLTEFSGSDYAFEHSQECNFMRDDIPTQQIFKIGDEFTAIGDKSYKKIPNSSFVVNLGRSLNPDRKINGKASKRFIIEQLEKLIPRSPELRTLFPKGEYLIAIDFEEPGYCQELLFQIVDKTGTNIGNGSFKKSSVDSELHESSNHYEWIVGLFVNGKSNLIRYSTHKGTYDYQYWNRNYSTVETFDINGQLISREYHTSLGPIKETTRYFRGTNSIQEKLVWSSPEILASSVKYYAPGVIEEMVEYNDGEPELKRKYYDPTLLEEGYFKENPVGILELQIERQKDKTYETTLYRPDGSLFRKLITRKFPWTEETTLSGDLIKLTIIGQRGKFDLPDGTDNSYSETYELI